ncbi:MAG: ABC transporter ATP-binding protein [Desulfobacterales bacterium]|nr:ABC transporter ATP-binding protein [Desulfobacterales bacterium]
MTDYILDVKNLFKSFGAIKASRDLSFKIKKGDIHAVIGPNGAGKTTLVNQISGDIRPDSGSIVFDGIEISQMASYQRAALGLARSFQITSIFENLSVAENMALSIIAHNGHNYRFWRNCLKTPIVIKELPAALGRVDLIEKSDHRAGLLSHGEKRQLEVGMALIGSPKMLVLDEPMAGMGPGGAVELSKLIRRIQGETTILLVEHDMEAVFALADYITVIVYGERIAGGPPDAIRRSVEVRSAYLGEE